jgi:DnaJ family protein C protein 11
MNDRVPGSRRAGSARGRNSSRSANSSARSSAAFERDYDQHLQPHNQLYSNRHNPSLRSVGSRFSLSDQFAATRREYEFGFDDGASFITNDAEAETDQDDTLTGAGSFDGVVVNAPASHRSVGNEVRQSQLERIRRSHYELLSLPPGDEVSERDICRAYFRLCEVLRSDVIPAQHQDVAERYLAQVQAAFETLISKRSRDDYDESLPGDELENSILLSGEEGEDDVNGDTRQPRRTDAQLVQILRRQQERESTEARLHLDAQSIATLKNRRLPRRHASPATFCLAQNSVASFPAISQLLQPRLRQIRKALSGTTPPTSVNFDKNELYCAIPTVTLTSSIFAMSEMDSYLPPITVPGRQPNLTPDALPKDRQLRWSSLYYALNLNFKLRQELFIREAGLSEAALKRTLPDAVLEIETDAINAASLTARASHVLRLGGDQGQNDQPAEPLHTEASISVSRVLPGASYEPRFGLGLHRRVGGGTVFACVDSGTASLWGSLSPSSFWNRSVREQLDRDSTGATWRKYSKQLLHTISTPSRRNFSPLWHMP